MDNEKEFPENEVRRLQAEADELRRQLNRANEEHERNRYLLRFLSDYIYSVKLYDGQVLETRHGPGCVAVTGYHSRDYLDDPELWYRMVHPDDRKAVTEQAKKARRGEEPGELQHRIIHREGHTIWVRNTIVLRHNDEGYLLGYYGLINNITELKRAEQLAEVKNNQLIQADKMASIGVLASGIAHEVNNPNNFIMLNSRLFEKIWRDALPILQSYYDEHGDFLLGGMSFEESRDKTEQLLQGMAKGSQRIKKIVNGLREFIGSSPKDVRQNVNVNKAIENALLFTRHLIKNSTDYFERQLDGNLPPIMGHAQQLEQVIINMLTNASQALTDRRQKMGIRSFFDAEEGMIEVAVYDQGAGIDEEQLKNIFDPFYTTKRDSGGTGLGLSISYTIVKNHKGHLFYESQKGHGSTARMRLPVSQNEVS